MTEKPINKRYFLDDLTSRRINKRCTTGLCFWHTSLLPLVKLLPRIARFLGNPIIGAFIILRTAFRVGCFLSIVNARTERRDAGVAAGDLDAIFTIAIPTVEVF